MTPKQDRLGLLGWLRLAWQWLRRPRVDLLELPGMNKSVMGFNLIHLFNRVDLLAWMIKSALELDLRPPRIGHTFPFTEAVEAMRTFQAGKTTGKVVLEAAS